MDALLELSHPSERVRAHPRYGTIRGVVEHGWCHTDKKIIDAFTASAAWQIVCHLNEQNALKYLNLLDDNPRRFGDITWELVKRNRKEV